MENTGITVDQLREKIEKLVSMHSRLKKEKGVLEKERSRLLEKNMEQREKISELEQRVKVLEISKSIADVSGGTKMAKLRVNRLLREIDSCIALMNK